MFKKKDQNPPDLNQVILTCRWEKEGFLPITVSERIEKLYGKELTGFMKNFYILKNKIFRNMV